ncbi:amino acid ABC transporter substrate-binding protein [Acidobacteria bacterium AB60]|nr:amino acid ABC transporter substrate-binding protein [Acidobacteria bacterium AB60]
MGDGDARNGRADRKAKFPDVRLCCIAIIGVAASADHMPNIEDVLKALRGLVDFASSHPYLSVPIIAIVLLMTIASMLKSFREQFGWIEEVVKHGAIRQRIALGVTLAIVLVIAVVAPIAVVHYRRPKPIFVVDKRVVLTREFNAQWTYSEDHNGDVKYHLVADSPSGHEEAFTTIPYHRVGLTGHVRLQVTAIQKNGRKRTSDPLLLEIYRDSLQRIVQTGRIIVGIHADDNPGVFCFNSSDAGYQGFDIDLSKEIARRIYAKYHLPYQDPEFRFYHWPELLSAPSSFEVDFIIASISRTPGRESGYGLRFSDPYYATQMGLVVRGGDRADISFDSLRRLRLGVNSTTTAASFADRLKLNVVKQPTKQEVFALLADGKVDGILYDYARSVSEAASRGWISRRINYDTIPKDLRPPMEEYAIATASLSDGLLAEINGAIHSIDTRGMIEGKIQNIAH